MVMRWVTQTGANNTVRRRLSVARTFWRWALREGFTANDPTVHLDYLTKQYPKTYGKVQAVHPARWLTHEQAFGALIGACRDGTQQGLRDELIIRLGLTGMRNAEIRHLRISDLHLANSPPELRWIGKGRKPRKVVPGNNLVQRIRNYLLTWQDETGQPPPPDAPLIATCPCGNATGRRGGTAPKVLLWGTPILAGSQLSLIITRRATLAGLGHVTTHDHRRSAAGILHNTIGADGGHVFDLLDIQKVLDHADPATTQRSYLDPMDNGVKAHAGRCLD
jgi:integrase